MIFLLLSCLPAHAAAVGTVALFRGTPGGVGDVVLVDPSGAQAPSSPPQLVGIHLEALDANGRTQITSLQPSSPRLRDDVPGATRIELPSDFGSLYAYSRATSNGRTFGLFVIDDAGSARSVFELAGTGPALDQLSFVPRVAIAASGNRALVATTLAAGGDLLEIDLTNGATTNRTSALAPQAFSPASLHLTPTWGIAGTATGVLRFDRGNALDAQAVPFSASPAWFSGEVVVSANGLHAATVAGAAPNAADVFAFDLTGSARKVTTQSATVSGAGFLPEALHGPYLAISDDGAWCAWRTETATSREAFLGPVPVATPTNNQDITDNAHYTDTLDEVGWFIFRGVTQKFVMAVGAVTTDAPGIENLDFYSVTPSSTGAPSILNLTQTNGIAQPPFLVQSELKPSALFAIPGTDSLLMHSEQSGGGGELVLASATQTGTTTVLANAKDLDFAERAGSRILVEVRRATGPKNRELFALAAPYTSAGPALFSVSNMTTFDRTAARPDGWFAFVQSMPNKERLWRYNPSTNTARFFSDRPLFYGPTIGWAPGGELAFSVGAGGVSSIFALWPTGSPIQRLSVPVGPGFVLPGV